MELPSLFIPANIKQEFDVISWSSLKRKRVIKTKTDLHTSQYLGVHLKSSKRKYEAQIYMNEYKVSLGSFFSEKLAAHASDLMVLWAEFHPTTPIRKRELNFERETYTHFTEFLMEFDFYTMLHALRFSERNNIKTK